MRSLVRSLAVVAVLALAGCSLGGGGADGASDDSAVGGEVAPDAPAGEESAADGGPDGAVGLPGADVAQPDPDRQVVVTGTVTIEVVDPQQAAQDAAALVDAAGGYVQEQQVRSARDGDHGSAYLVTRIPAAQVTATLAQLGELGEVIDSNLTSTEVTATARDLDARIRALELSITRLEDLLGRAGSIDDVVAAEQVLTDRQSQLEQLQSQRRALADQVDMSTVRLDLFTEADVPEPEPEPVPPGFLGGLETGWRALVTAVQATLSVLGVLTPWLALAGLVTAVVVWVRRRRGRRVAATALPPVSPATGPTTTLPPVPSDGPAAPPVAPPAPPTTPPGPPAQD